MSSANLEARLETLEAMASIQQLKARYALLADAKYTSDYQRLQGESLLQVAQAQAECFSEDAVWKGGDGFGGDIVGRDGLTQWFTRSPWRFAMHFYVSPSMEVAGATAHATWRLWQLALREDNAEAVLLAAITEESYARQADRRWLCSHMRFSQIHMASLGQGPLPLAKQLSQLGLNKALHLQEVPGVAHA